MTTQGPGAPRQSGTVYGRGGADPSVPPAPGRRLHPAVLILVISAALMVVVALGYWVFRSPAEPSGRAAAAATGAAASRAAAPAAASASPSPSPVEELATGTWHVSLAADPSLHLRTDDEFAAMAGGDPMRIDVVPGLADKDCFSFSNPDGEFLRHFDYRLRFDKRGKSKLFREDATFCATGEQPAGAVRLASKNYPEHQLHRRDGGELYIDKPDGSDGFAKDSTFSISRPD